MRLIDHVTQASTSATEGQRPCALRWASVVIFALSVGVLLSPVQALPAMADEHGSMSHEGALHDAHSPSAAPDEYSLFMHHSSGVALIVLAILVLSDRLTRGRIAAIQLGIALIWLGFGAHLFIRSDPEGWPIGPAGFLESFSMPTSVEWIQHKLLSLIPLTLGLWTLITRGRVMKTSLSYALGGLLALGGAALLFHQHLEHQTMDLVNLQHRFMAITSLFIAGSAMADGIARAKSPFRPFLLPSGLMLLGVQLVIYVE
jgi:putative copper resistance protein D